MEHGSSSRPSWVDEVEEEDLAALAGLNPNAAPFLGGSLRAGSGSDGLNPDAWPFFGGCSGSLGYGERLSVMDSEASDDSSWTRHRWKGGERLPRPAVAAIDARTAAAVGTLGA